MSNRRRLLIPEYLHRLTAVFQVRPPDARPSIPRTPVQRYLQGRVAGALGLLTGAVIALLWANSPWAPGYLRLRDAALVFGPASAPIQVSFRLFINEFLMTAFFVSLGLAAKRQESAADLRTTLPAALAAIVLPALLLGVGARFILGPRGWLIVTASDLGFMAAALAALHAAGGGPGRRFKLSFAAAADVVAVLALVAFGASPLRSLPFAGMALAAALHGLAGRLRGLRAPALALTGFLFWASWTLAGLPPAVAGVVLALFASSRPAADERITAEAADALVDRYDDAVDDPTSDRRSALAAGLSDVARRAEPETDRWQRRLAPWLALLVLPLFGWANAGVALNRSMLAGISVGTTALLVTLLLGKPAGFLAVSWAMERRRMGGAMEQLSVRQVVGFSLLSASGGATALYAATRALPPGEARDAACAAILVVTVAAALLGAATVRRTPSL